MKIREAEQMVRRARTFAPSSNPDVALGYQSALDVIADMLARERQANAYRREYRKQHPSTVRMVITREWAEFDAG